MFLLVGGCVCVCVWCVWVWGHACVYCVRACACMSALACVACVCVCVCGCPCAHAHECGCVCTYVHVWVGVPSTPPARLHRVTLSYVLMKSSKAISIAGAPQLSRSTTERHWDNSYCAIRSCIYKLILELDLQWVCIAHLAHLWKMPPFNTQ